MPSIKLFDSLEEALTKLPLGTTACIVVEDTTISLVNHNNLIYGIQNSCPHLGESLSKGKVNYLGEIVCPWHSYRFNLKTGEEAERRCGDANIYPIKIEADGVYITV